MLVDTINNLKLDGETIEKKYMIFFFLMILKILCFRILKIKVLLGTIENIEPNFNKKY